MTQNGTDTEHPAAADTGAEPDLATAVSRLPEVLSVHFTTKFMGGAYDRHEVDVFIGQLSQAVASVRSATTRTEQELAALRDENAQLRSAPRSDLEEEITAGAMELLTQAQLIADKAIADAEHYARDLVVTARNQYREILERAETSASQVTATVGGQQQPGPAVPEIEYVRTYARVAQIQLRSVLEALTEQVDRLGTLPRPAEEPGAVVRPAVVRPAADEGPTGEPDWVPSASEHAHQG